MSRAYSRAQSVLFGSVNRAVVPLLRSPLHRTLSGRLMVITYAGVRSGAEYSIPVAYYRWGDDEVRAFAARTGWMTNFREPRDVSLRLRGRELPAKARAVEDRERVAAMILRMSQHDGVARLWQDPFLGLPKGRLPTREEAFAAAGRARIARFHLSDAPPE